MQECLCLLWAKSESGFQTTGHPSASAKTKQKIHVFFMSFCVQLPKDARFPPRSPNIRPTYIKAHCVDGHSWVQCSGFSSSIHLYTLLITNPCGYEIHSIYSATLRLKTQNLGESFTYSVRMTTLHIMTEIIFLHIKTEIMQDLYLPWSSCSSSFLPIQIDTNGQHTTAHGQGQRSKCSSFLRPEDILDVTTGRLSARGCLLNPATSKKKTLCGQNSLKSEHSQHSAIGNWQSCFRVSYAQPTRMKKRNCMEKVVAWAGAAGSKITSSATLKSQQHEHPK